MSPSNYDRPGPFECTDLTLGKYQKCAHAHHAGYPLKKNKKSNRGDPALHWTKRGGMGLPALLGGKLGCRIV